MPYWVHKRILLVGGLLTAIMLLAGCSDQTTIETGYVAETTITETVESSGSIEAKQLATLSWATSGNVEKINVETNSLVASGDELMTLDPTSVSIDVLQAITTLIDAKQELEDAKHSKTELAKAEVALVSAQQVYNDALIEYNQLDEPVGSAEYIAVLQSAYLSAQNSTERALKDYFGAQEAAEGSVKRTSAEARLAQARINENDALIRLNHFSNPPDEITASTVTAAFNLAKAQLDAAQIAYDALKDGNSALVDSAQAAVDAAQATVNKISITAPFDGEVVVVYSQVGDVVSTQTKALILVDRSKLTVDVLVEEADIYQVEIGNKASVSIDTLGINTTGKVIRVNPIGIVSGGVVNYYVTVELDEANPDILIGTTATVVITTGEPCAALYVPVGAVLMDDQGEYVTRIQNDGTTERVAVVTGDIADGYVVVTGDLQKGQSIQIFTTTTSDSSSTSSQGGRGSLFGFGRIFGN